jgi:translation initiation factor 1
VGVDVKRPTGGGLVYSTHHGQMCPTCRKPAPQCSCRRAAAPPRGDGIVRVGRETQGRNGAGVTVISGVPLAGEALAELASQLKRRCGAGGTVKDGVIELQGEHRDTAVAALEKLGYRVKRVGG